MEDRLPGECRLVPLTVRGDERGNLIALEELREIPFSVARVYYLYGTCPGVTRGLHAHRELRQFAVAVAGSCRMLLDDGKDRTTVDLGDPSLGLILPPMVWHEMSEFTADCVLMVLADAPYDEADYIRDYGSFLAALA